MVGSVVTSTAAASVSVAQVLHQRASGLTEPETWALLCQAAQALQDLFLARKATISQNVPHMCPTTLRVTRHGRVTITPDTATGYVSATGDKFLAPEYNRQQLWVSDGTIEKMWIYSLGATLRETAVVTRGQGHMSGPLEDVLETMTLADPRRRASLMDVLDVISEYCKSRLNAKPFSHIAMELWREVLGNTSLSPVTQCLPPVTDVTPVMATGQGSCSVLPRSRPGKTPVGKSCSLKESRPARRHPVQRAPSRLYRAVSSIETKSHAKYTCPNTCIGPEFVVRAAAPSKRVHVGEKKSNHERKVVVILLNGQKLEIFCDPTTTTAGQIFEVVIQVEKLEDNFTLGLAALLTGDFVFLSEDTRLCKVAPKKESIKYSLTNSLTLYLRVKFFLPSLRGVRKWTTKHLLYLQLRRSMLEQQIQCDLSQHVALSGLALQAEFGDFIETEHGCGDYFILDHYIPENILEGEEKSIRSNLIQQHRDRRGNDPGRAEEIYICEVQKLNNYGSHFYSATCINKKKPHPPMWIAVSGQGIFLYDKCDGGEWSLNKLYVWRDIQKLCYSKQYFLLHPSGDVTGIKPAKHKFLLDFNKSFFVFQLASLHHQFFMKLRIELSSLQSLSVEFGVPLRRFGKDNKKLFYVEDNTPNDELDNLRTLVPYISQDKTIAPVTEDTLKEKNSISRSREKSTSPTYMEEIQNKENENPSKHNKSETLWQEEVSHETQSLPYLHSPSPSDIDSSTYKTTSYPRRLRVKMGTRAFLNTPKELFTSTDTVELSEIASPSPAETSAAHSPLPDVYVLNSSIKSTDERFHLDFQETLSESLIEKFDNVSFADERILRTLRLRRDNTMSLGIQITEGSDGGVYIQSVTPGGAACILGTIHPGDQLIAVDGHTLLNMKYRDSLQLLQATGHEVELVLSQVDSGEPHCDLGDQHYPLSPQQQHSRRYSSGIDLLSEILQKPIEDSYLKNIRYETAVEIDSEGNDMVSSPIPVRNFRSRLEKCVRLPPSHYGGHRVGDVSARETRGWRSPEKVTNTAPHSLRAVCCVMPADEELDHRGRTRHNVYI